MATPPLPAGFTLDTGEQEEPTAVQAPAPARQGTPPVPEGFSLNDNTATTAPAAPEAPKSRGFVERAGDAYEDAARQGMGWLARRGQYYFGPWKDKMRQRFPNASDDEIEEMTWEFITQADRAGQEEAARRQAADPAWRPDESFFENALSLDRWVPTLGGTLVGSASPVDAIAPGGGTIARRIGGAAVLNMGENVASQGVDIADEVQDEYNPIETGVAGALGAGFQGAFELPKALARRGRDTDVEADIASSIEEGATVDELRQSNPEYFEQNPDAESVLQQWVDYKASGGEAPVQFRDEETSLPQSVDPENFDQPTVAKSGKMAYEQTIESKEGNQYYAEFDSGADKPVTAQITVRPDGTATVNVATEAIENAANSANTRGAPAIRSMIDDIITEFPEIKSISGERVTGARSQPSEFNINENMVTRLRERKAQQTPLEEAAADVPEPENPTYSGNVNTRVLGVRTPEEREMLDNITAELTADPVTAQAVVRDAQELLDTKSVDEILSTDPRASEFSQYGVARRYILNDALQRNVRAAEEYNATPVGKITPELEANIQAARMELAAAVESVSGQARTAGRILNAQKLMGRRIEEGSPLRQASDANTVSTENWLELVERYKDDPEALQRAAKDSTDPKFEDYMFSLRYNFMLSSPKTHFVNILGNMTHNVLEEGVARPVAALIGLTRRGSADRVTVGELGHKMTGTVAAARDIPKNVVEAYRSGIPLDQVNRTEQRGPVFTYAADKIKNPALRKIAKAVTQTLESPTRALAAEDEFFRTLAYGGELYAQAYRAARKEGFEGPDLTNRVREILENPDSKIIQAAEDHATFTRFQNDAPGLLKALESMRNRRGEDDVISRLAKIATNTVIPFARTLENVARMPLRWSPIGILSSKNNAWKQGRDLAERDIAIARIMVGTAMWASMIELARQGLMTGPEKDWRQISERVATGQPPNSLQLPEFLGGGQMSVQGLEPLSIFMTAAAQYVEAEKDMTAEDKLQSGLLMAEAVSEAMYESYWANSLGDLFGMFQGPEGLRDRARINYATNLVSSFTNPAVVRDLNTLLFDDTPRSARADTVGESIVNRVKAGTPGMSEDLPVRYDVFGQEAEQFRRFDTLQAPDDPVVAEIARLREEFFTDSAIIGPPGRRVNINGVSTKLNERQYQEYQQLSGQLILNDIRSAMADPEWQEAPDILKMDMIDDIKKDARKDAREMLFESGEATEETSGESIPVPEGFTLDD